MSKILPVAIGLLLVAGLVAALTAYATAAGQAELLAAQLEVAKAEVVEAAVARERAVARADSAALYSDSVQEASRALIADARSTASTAEAAGDSVFAELLTLTDSLPEMRLAIVQMRAEFNVERFAWAQERRAHESAASALRGQVAALTLERITWEAENGSLRDALALSQQESDAWQRAAKPGALRQLWSQGRAAALVAVVILAVR